MSKLSLSNRRASRVPFSLSKPRSQLLCLWLGWLVVLLTFQVLVAGRFKPMRPDQALPWTASRTQAFVSASEHRYTDAGFLAGHIAWDSDFYLSIACYGYDDARVGVIVPPDDTQTQTTNQSKPLSLNYAFLPLYPLAIRLVSVPIGLFLSQAQAAVAAGILISVLGSLIATLSLYELCKQDIGESGGQRAAYYFLIFPTAFFLAQVYTEALFLALAYTALLYARKERYGVAGVLAAFAVLSRPTGAALALSLLLFAVNTLKLVTNDTTRNQSRNRFSALPATVLASLPIVVFAAWHFSYLGRNFAVVQSSYFGTSTFDLQRMLPAIEEVSNNFVNGPAATKSYYLLDLFALVLAVVSCFRTRLTSPDLFVFSALSLALPLFSGLNHSYMRYVLAAPSIYVYLATKGQGSEWFDRCWSLLSILLLGMLTTLFTFDFWVG